MRAYTLFIACCAISPAMCAQDAVTPPEDPLGNFAKRFRLSLRQSVLDKNAIEKPASLQIVQVSEGEDSYAIDVGVTFRLLDTERWFVGPLAEYHRQTELAKPQDNFQAGLTVINITGDVTKDPVTNFVQGTLKYKNDRITTGEALLGKIDYTPLAPRAGIGTSIGSDNFEVIWQPTVGLQYESADDVRKTGLEGDEARAMANIEVAFFPWAKPLHHRLQFVARETYWHAFARSGAFETFGSDYDIFRASLTWYLDGGRHFGVGIDYSNGSDPELGLLRQELTTFSLKVRF
jgi:hypothetical protein